MSTTKDPDDRDPYIGTRVDDELKRKADIRATARGQNMSEYLISLIEDDLRDVEWIDEVDLVDS